MLGGLPTWIGLAAKGAAQEVLGWCNRREKWDAAALPLAADGELLLLPEE